MSWLVCTWRRLSYRIREAKWFIQRRTRGYSDQDTWNAGYAIAEYALPLVRSMLDDADDGICGVPGKLYFVSDDPDSVIHRDEEEAAAEWRGILEDIVYALEEMLDEDSHRPADYERYERGLRLFGEWLPAMWT